MAGLEGRNSCRRIFPEKKILTVVSLFIYKTVLVSIGKGLPKNTNIHGHNTRFGHNYNLPYHRTRLYEKKP
ncbi:hypothetical protein, partial [Klebsiella pneumoniae]|uniref:hypothetical protein n=1 Tax=Klebsiella pneumoniae TaxID=573 RepID=UPI001C8F4DF3